MAFLAEKDENGKFLPLSTRTKERVINLIRGKEKGIVVEESKSSFAMREDGNITLASSKTSQSKMNAKEGKNGALSLEDLTIANTKQMVVDEIIINYHKLNNALFEFTDPKMVYENPNKIVTGINLQSTVMVKAWEPTLKRYVLIRRPARFAPFGPELNIPPVPENLSIEADIQYQFKDMYEIKTAADKFVEFAEKKIEEQKEAAKKTIKDGLDPILDGYKEFGEGLVELVTPNTNQNPSQKTESEQGR